MIEVSHLTRRYGPFVAVDDVSFQIGQGEVVGLLGHNGAGKTTIMKMVTGYIEPSAGEIKVDGVDVQTDPVSVQADMGYLPESLPIYPELTVADYLTHTAILRGVDPKSSVGDALHATQMALSAICDALHATQMADKAFDQIETLSRGYKQRLGVAQAILHKPKFLILDEPSNGLDPNQIRHMRTLIRQLAETATVILSTHIMQEVSAVCDRTLIVRGGKLVVDEKLSDLQAATGALLKTDSESDVSSVLADVPGMLTADSQGEGTWRLSFEGEVETAIAAVAQKLVSAELPIYSLAPEARDLEAVFAEVNQGVEEMEGQAQGGAQHAA